MQKIKIELSKAQKQLSRNDKKLAVLIRMNGGCTIKPHKNYFETLVDTIISQQLSVKAAETIYRRFKLLFSTNGEVPKNFPLPVQILKMDSERMRSCGMSYPKVSYVKDLCEKVVNGNVKIHLMGRLSNEEIITELIQVKGIGEWSAHMFLIFCLGRLDVLPVGDLGFKNAVKKVYKLRISPKPEKIKMIAKKNNWSPYQSVATWYLWRSLNNS